MRKSDGARVPEKKNNGVRLHHEGKSDKVRVHHEKE